jgi:hypothetical protein
MMPQPECPACRVQMEEGHVLDTGDGNRLHRVYWNEGPAEKGGLHGHRIRGKRRIETSSFRCPRCGWLIWFAPESGV